MNKLIQQAKGYSIQLGESGQVYRSNIDGSGLYIDPEKITEMLNNGEFGLNVLIILFDNETSSGHKLMPSQKTIDRLYKIIYGTHYKIIYRNGPVWEIEGCY